MLVDIQSAPLHIPMHTHISFPPQVLRASQLLGVPLQSGLIWEMWRQEEGQRLHYFPSPPGGRGQRCVLENNAASAEEGSQDKRVSSLANILSANSELHQPCCNILSKTEEFTVQMAQVQNWGGGDSKMQVCIIE